MERNWLEELNRSLVMPEDYAKHNLMARREFFELSCEDLPRRGQDQFTLLRDLTHCIRCGGDTCDACDTYLHKVRRKRFLYGTL